MSNTVKIPGKGNVGNAAINLSDICQDIPALLKTHIPNVAANCSFLFFEEKVQVAFGEIELTCN
jgi:hypothetical protein